ncbi:MAG: sigma-54-dependent Fis family transcriptional regulator [Gammaproteobacteria bacterium]|nr:MAG: sigma-54-dependent Fis family transcriptional regulator [Gammaproteobacteria bacterium]
MRELLVISEGDSSDSNKEELNVIGDLLVGWKVDRYCDWAEVHRNCSGYLLGLFVVSDKIVEDRVLLEKLESHLRKADGMDWIAVVRPHQFDSPAIKAFLARYVVDYLSFPILGSKEKIEGIFDHLYGMAELRKREDSCVYLDHERIIGNCPAMENIHKLIPKFAASDAPILISGDSGTGKELIAQTLHQQSVRKQERFVAVNCGAIPENLVESELFGHVKGAFTGADRDKKGKIELADNGTLFLDEIGDLPLSQQVKILRFLQEGTINPVGLAEARNVNVRIIAASHVSLEEAMKTGAFRPDLFYRLNVLQIHAPALIDRRADIELLAQHFLKKYRNEGLGIIKGFTKEAINSLKAHLWPGNIRELINRVRKAVVLCETSLISPHDLGLGLVPAEPKYVVQGNLVEARNHVEKATVVGALASNDQNITHAAKQLGVSRMTLYRMLEKHKIVLSDSTSAVV